MTEASRLLTITSRKVSSLTGVGFVCLLGIWWLTLAPQSRALVVYCAHDAEYAEPILRQFEQQTGIPLDIRYDTEATKSLGLVQLIERERLHPRCDVFWNGEILGTMELARQGRLTPYAGSGAARIPDRYKDPEARWTGFGARLRVWIVHTPSLQPDEAALARGWQTQTTRFAIAKPLYGTTLTHYCALWSTWGPEKLQAWHREARRRGIQEVDGNARVKDLVAKGLCQAGLTDTDDYLVAKRNGAPVDMLPVRLDNRATICIPNTVAIVQGTKHLTEAQRLVDYLLSEQTELALAQSDARQIPLGPVPADKLPPELKDFQRWAQEGIPLQQLALVRTPCLAWLKQEYFR